MPHPNNIPPSPPSPRSKLFAGLFLYQGGLPFSPLADLARMNPRPLILYGLEGNALVVNVVEGGREEKERLRGRLWAGCVIKFHHKSKSPFTQTLQQTTFLPSVQPFNLTSSSHSPSALSTALIKKLNAKLPQQSTTTLKIVNLRLAAEILDVGDGEGEMKILKENDGVAAPFRGFVEMRLWELRGLEEGLQEVEVDGDEECGRDSGVAFMKEEREN